MSTKKGEENEANYRLYLDHAEERLGSCTRSSPVSPAVQTADSGEQITNMDSKETRGAALRSAYKRAPRSMPNTAIQKSNSMSYVSIKSIMYIALTSLTSREHSVTMKSRPQRPFQVLRSPARWGERCQEMSTLCRLNIIQEG